ncbi:MAG: hypothetical protein SGARI_004345 [Bacillariaceae sp.]
MAQEQASDTSYVALEEGAAVAGGGSPCKEESGRSVAQKSDNVDSVKVDTEERKVSHQSQLLSLEDKGKDEETAASSTEIEFEDANLQVRPVAPTLSAPKVTRAGAGPRSSTATKQLDLSDFCKGICHCIGLLFACAIGALIFLIVVLSGFYDLITFVVDHVLFWKLTVAHGSLDGSEECDATAKAFYWIMTVSFAASWAFYCLFCTSAKADTNAWKASAASAPVLLLVRGV